MNLENKLLLMKKKKCKKKELIKKMAKKSKMIYRHILMNLNSSKIKNLMNSKHLEYLKNTLMIQPGKKLNLNDYIFIHRYIHISVMSSISKYIVIYIYTYTIAYIFMVSHT